MKAGRWEGLTPAARAVLFSRPEADRTEWAENITSVSACGVPLQAGGEKVQRVPELGWGCWGPKTRAAEP